MSQEKVDRYKQQKKDREKIKKRKHRRKVAGICVLLAAVGCAIGFPLGQKLYKVSVEHRKATATISSSLYPYWIQEYWDSEYAGYWVSDTATDTDATDTDSKTATSSDAATAE